MTESEKTAIPNEAGINRWLKDLNETYPPDDMELQSYVFQPNQRRTKMDNQDMKEALKDVNMEYRKDAIFVEVLNLRAHVARLLKRIDELERHVLP